MDKLLNALYDELYDQIRSEIGYTPSTTAFNKVAGEYIAKTLAQLIVFKMDVSEFMSALALEEFDENFKNSPDYMADLKPEHMPDTKKAGRDKDGNWTP